MTIRCPVCGIAVEPSSIPVGRNASFECHRCRADLTVVKSDTRSILVASLLIAFTLCFVSGGRGLMLFASTIALTAMFYFVGRLLRDFIVNPRLERTVNLAKRAHSTRI